MDMLDNETMNMIPARHDAITANHMNAVIYSNCHKQSVIVYIKDLNLSRICEPHC